MRLTQQLTTIGRQLVIGGAIAIACGVIIFLVENAGVTNLPGWGLVILFAALIFGGVYLFQSKIYWRSLRTRLLAAAIVEVAPQHPYRPLPRWVWALWAVIALTMAYSVNGPFAIFFGSLLLGYGLSSPVLARNVTQLEADRVQFHASRDPKTRRAVVVRTVVSTDGEDE